MIKGLLNSTDSFNNPFEEINANVIDAKKIVEYWCNPFELGIMPGFDEHRFLTSKIPIIIQGSRGSGKTTILKYFSFPAQIQRTEILREKSVLNRITKEGEIGFYYRCEESFIATFTAIFRNVNPEYWTRFFECYIELVFSEKILEMLSELKQRGEILEMPKESIEHIASKVGIKEISAVSSLNGLYSIVHNEVIYFEQYKNRTIFSEEQFTPKFLIDIFSLSKAIISEIKATIPALRNVNFILMIDEFENLEEDLQKRFNTIIKFAKDDVSIRIGRRREGLFTTETVNEVEYLRENHDFFLASLDTDPDIHVMKSYFIKVANRRFRQTEPFVSDEGQINIVDMLGDMEDLLEECKNVCGTQKKHVDSILKQSKILATDTALRTSILEIIKNDDNPIAESINALWVIREKKKNPMEIAEYAASAMNAYFDDKVIDGVEKYKLDYSSKYRYAITVFICSVYKKDKLYYGLNAISHLANGNVRAFINLCQSVISDALFYEKNSFLKTWTISKEVQSHAIKKFSRTEFDGTCAVVNAGDRIKRLVLNLGNAFDAYHKDSRIRYPETTQFDINSSKLKTDDYKVLEIAKGCAIIIKRQKVQRTSAGVSDRTELYHINKIFSPLFNMSYRTRGGVNLRLSENDFHEMLNSDSYLPPSVRRLIKSQATDDFETRNDSCQQLSLLDNGVENE